MGNTQKNPNPQGKGVVPVLQDWGALRPVGAGARNAPEFLRNYCISSLVLSAQFKFRPVVGNTYFLYVKDNTWTLSMVDKTEWHDQGPGNYLAPCRLRQDMTWEIDSNALEEGESLDRLQDFVEAFVETLRGQSSISAELPYYVSHLPYYQRMLATALSASLAQSWVDMEEVKQLANAGLALPGVAGR